MTISQLQTICTQLQLSSIKQYLPDYIKQAERQSLSYDDFLLGLFQQELDNRQARRAVRRVKEAKFPTVKTLDGFDFERAPQLPESLLRRLTNNDYIKSAEPIIFIGEPGTGKTHLACALGYAAAADGYSVRFIAASQLVNLLIEAKDSRVLSSITSRFARYKLLIIDELGYLPLSKADSELLFQVISQRQELWPTIITTNLPFSEWTTVFPDQRLCKAFIDRVTHKAHIIESGEKSVRLEDTMKKMNNKGGK